MKAFKVYNKTTDQYDEHVLYTTHQAAKDAVLNPKTYPIMYWRAEEDEIEVHPFHCLLNQQEIEQIDY